MPKVPGPQLGHEKEFCELHESDRRPTDVRTNSNYLLWVPIGEMSATSGDRMLYMPCREPIAAVQDLLAAGIDPPKDFSGSYLNSNNKVVRRDAQSAVALIGDYGWWLVSTPIQRFAQILQGGTK